MSRLIDAELLERKIINHRRTAIHKDDIISLIADIPTVDAVRVVRCKDCGSRNKQGECCRSGLLVNDNDFCSREERRTDEKET